MYRYLAHPQFRAAYRAARRNLPDKALLCLEKASLKAAQTLVKQLDEATAGTLLWSPLLISAAKVILDRVFKSQDTVAFQDELAALSAAIDESKAGQPPAEEPPVEAPRSMANEHEEAEACVLRVAWMGEIGNSAADIADSLRYNRPQSAAKEQHLLDLVRQWLEVERAHDEAMRTCT